MVRLTLTKCYITVVTSRITSRIRETKKIDILALPLITEENVPNEEDTNKHPKSVVEENDEQFFHQWSLTNNSNKAREALEIIYPPLDVEFTSECSWNDLIDNFALNTF